jgi:Ca2+-binding RTX toxin-like protein
MAKKRRRRLRGTNGADELTGTRRKRWIYGRGGDDIISAPEGRYRAWGGDDADTFKTLNGGKGFMRIMDFEVGDTITFCGCASTRIEQFGKKGQHARIVKGDDIKAIVNNVKAEDLNIDFENAVITLNPDPLA